MMMYANATRQTHAQPHTQGLGKRTTIRAIATRSATSDDGRVPVRNLRATIDSKQPTHQQPITIHLPRDLGLIN